MSIRKLNDPKSRQRSGRRKFVKSLPATPVHHAAHSENLSIGN